MAIEWGQVSAEVKQEYVERAEVDKERYNKEFATYQQTQEYKDFIAEQKDPEKDVKQPATKKAKKDEGSSNSSKKSKKKPAAVAAAPPRPPELAPQGPSAFNNVAAAAESMDDKQHVQAAIASAAMTTATTSVTPVAASSNSSSSHTIDIPIFTEEFLEHNKTKEAELRQLRKQANEFEEQNAILQKHVENMRSAIGKLELETLQQQENNAALAKHLESLRRLVISHFAGTHLSPHRKEPLTMDNVDAYMAELRKIVQERPKENEALVAKAKDIASRMNYDTLTAT